MPKLGSFDPTKDKVFTPEPGSVFVFGSNLRGAHGGGAAALAHKKYGAKYGVGEGLFVEQLLGPAGLVSKDTKLVLRGENGCTSYALPTKGFDIETLPLTVIEYFVERLYLCTVNYKKNLKFFVTRVGCGLGGYTDNDMAPLFRDFSWPRNVTLPLGWE